MACPPQPTGVLLHQLYQRNSCVGLYQDASVRNIRLFMSSGSSETSLTNCKALRYSNPQDRSSPKRQSALVTGLISLVVLLILSPFTATISWHARCAITAFLKPEFASCNSGVREPSPSHSLYKTFYCTFSIILALKSFLLGDLFL
jgi:hypothetical protein